MKKHEDSINIFLRTYYSETKHRGFVAFSSSVMRQTLLHRVRAENSGSLGVKTSSVYLKKKHIDSLRIIGFSIHNPDTIPFAIMYSFLCGFYQMPQSCVTIVTVQLQTSLRCPEEGTKEGSGAEETSKKRKPDDKEESTSQIKKPALQKPAKKVKVKKLSEADKNLANRESALASADLEEEIHKEQEQERRKSQVRGKAAGGEALDEDQRPKIPVNPEEERLKNERTVFVGNLPVTCNKKKLKSLFKEYGPIESVRFRSVMPAEGTLTKKLAAIKRKFHPDQKSINAYVVFKDESAAAKALQRNGAQIAEGFRIRVDLASETTSRDKRSVFVGNLPYSKFV
ncbi:RNA-binding protein 34 [Sigmodon hispidus]